MIFYSRVAKPNEISTLSLHDALPILFTPSPIRSLLAGYFAAALASIPSVTGLTSTNGFPVGVFVLLLKVVVNWFSWAIVRVTGTGGGSGQSGHGLGGCASNLSSPCPRLASGDRKSTRLNSSH